MVRIQIKTNKKQVKSKVIELKATPKVKPTKNYKLYGYFFREHILDYMHSH